MLQKVRRFLGTQSQSVELHNYECAECGIVFESAKSPERVQCMECLSNDVEKVD